MTELATSEIVGAWVGIFLTIAVLSFLYGDNPFYKFAEHLFVGVSIGYVVVVQFRDNFITKVERGLTWWDVVPLVLVLLMYVKFAFKKLAWTGRFPLAFVVALYAGQSVVGLVGSDLGDQIKVAATSLRVDRVDLNTAPPNKLSSLAGISPTVATKLAAERARAPFASLDDALSRPSLTPSERDDLAAERGPIVGLDARASVAPDEVDWFGVASQVLLLLALLSGLLYFYFSVAHKGAVGKVSRFGVWMLMIGFGASFGFTVQGRIALAIGRAQDVRGKFMSEADAAHVHGELAAIVSAVIVIAGIAWWERRARRARGGAPAPDAAG
ncbi:MAG: helix-hairpin-helix domain-containing protein [Proteobacteria bacterium]|nr:helix-hairpin-helix domain-containing protein [Pseudomonadota bacterium]